MAVLRIERDVEENQAFEEAAPPTANLWRAVYTLAAAGAGRSRDTSAVPLRSNWDLAGQTTDETEPLPAPEIGDRVDAPWQNLPEEAATDGPETAHDVSEEIAAAEAQEARAIRVTGRVYGMIQATAQLVNPALWGGSIPGHRLVEKVLGNSAVMLDGARLRKFPPDQQAAAKQRAATILAERAERDAADLLTLGNPNWFQPGMLGPSSGLGSRMTLAELEAPIRVLARAQALGEQRLSLPPYLIDSIKNALWDFYKPSETGPNSQRRQTGAQSRTTPEHDGPAALAAGQSDRSAERPGEAPDLPNGRAPVAVGVKTDECGNPPPGEVSPSLEASPVATPEHDGPAALAAGQSDRSAERPGESGNPFVREVRRNDPNELADEERRLINDYRPAELLRGAALQLDYPDLTGRISVVPDDELVKLGREITGSRLTPEKISKKLVKPEETGDGHSEPTAGFSDEQLEKGMAAISAKGLKTWKTIHGKLEQGRPVTQKEWFDLYCDLQAVAERVEGFRAKLGLFETRAANVLATCLIENHRVNEGDTLAELAVRYGTTPEAILEINSIGQQTGELAVGQNLTIPIGPQGPDWKIIKGWQDDLLRRTSDPESVGGESRIDQIRQSLGLREENAAGFLEGIAALQKMAASRLPEEFLANPDELAKKRLKVAFGGLLMRVMTNDIFTEDKKENGGVKFTELGEVVDFLTHLYTDEQLFALVLADLNRQNTVQALLDGEIQIRERGGEAESGKKSLPLSEVLEHLCAMYGCEWDEEMFAKEAKGLKGSQGEAGLQFTLSQLRTIVERMQKAQGGEMLAEMAGEYVHGGSLRLISALGVTLGRQLLEFFPSALTLEPGNIADQTDLEALRALAEHFPEDRATYGGLVNTLRLYGDAPEGRFRPVNKVEKLMESPISEDYSTWRSPMAAFENLKSQFFPAQYPALQDILDVVCDVVGAVDDMQLTSRCPLLEKKEHREPPIGNILLLSDPGMGKTTGVVSISGSIPGVILLRLDWNEMGPTTLEAGFHSDDLASFLHSKTAETLKVSQKEALDLMQRSLIYFFFDQAEAGADCGETQADTGIRGADPAALRSALLSLMTPDGREARVKWIDGKGKKREDEVSTRWWNFIFAMAPEGKHVRYARALKRIPPGADMPVTPDLATVWFGPQFVSRCEVLQWGPDRSRSYLRDLDTEELGLAKEMDSQIAKALGKSPSDLTPAEIYVGQCYLYTRNERCPQHRIWGREGKKGSVPQALEDAIKYFGGNPAKVSVDLDPEVHEEIMRHACRPNEEGEVSLREYDWLPGQLGKLLVRVKTPELGAASSSKERVVKVRVTRDDVRRAIELRERRTRSI